jgi:hypothetical protein
MTASQTWQTHLKPENLKSTKTGLLPALKTILHIAMIYISENKACAWKSISIDFHPYSTIQWHSLQIS